MPTVLNLPLIFLFLTGLCVGSFCNVLIFRIPLGEEFVRSPSHCLSCGRSLRWYENIPLLSWLAQGGRCRRCGTCLSMQYPIVEALNAGAWLLCGLIHGTDLLLIGLYCALSSLLLVIAVIDWRTFLIPNGLNLAVFLLGLVQLSTDPSHWEHYLIGMISAGGLFFLIHILTGGAGLGMGDVKLMFGAGLLLGGGRVLLAVLIASLSGSIVHTFRMRGGAGKKLAFGPYLSVGIWIAAVFGDRLIRSYLGLFGL